MFKNVLLELFGFLFFLMKILIIILVLIWCEFFFLLIIYNSNVIDWISVININEDFFIWWLMLGIIVKVLGWCLLKVWWN